MRSLEDLTDLAASQLGCFTSRQAADLGIDRRVLLRRERRGELRRLTSRVWVASAVPITDEVCARAALLHIGGGAVLSHDSAAACFDIPGFTLAPIHVTSRRSHRNDQRGDDLVIAGRRVFHHTSKVLPDHHSCEVNGIPTMTPTRMLFSLSTRVHAHRLARMIDRVWAHRRTSWRRLRAMFSELARRGRGRIATMRRILDARGAEYRPPESNLEARAGQILRCSALGRYERQVVVGDEDGDIGRVDYLNRELGVVVEIDSDVHHTSPSDTTADAVRDNRLERAGYIVARVPEHEVWYDRDAMVDRVRVAEARARAARARIAA